MAAPPAGTAQTIFNDLNGTSAPYGGEGFGLVNVGGGQTAIYGNAAAFKPSGQSSKLTEVQALLSFVSGTNEMIVSLCEDAGNVPGTVIESWSLNSDELPPLNFPGVITMHS